MTQSRLGQILGDVTPQAWRQHHNEGLIDSLAHRTEVVFDQAKHDAASQDIDATTNPESAIAHQAGVNCIAIDNNDAQYLFSGGADSTIRVWDLDSITATFSDKNASSAVQKVYHPVATSSRSTPTSHTHALTSISIYPFDPTPSTLLSTAYDKTLKVTSITPTSLTTIHTFSLDYAPYTHSVSTVPDSSPLIAVGTAHPSVRLLDLRSGLSTHSLSGPNGAIYALVWSPRIAHLLASGSADGKVLFYDIRRANAAFASLDHDDAVGVIGDPPSTGSSARPTLLDFNATAHNGPVTSVQWTPSADKIVTTGHDQRIRVWDAASGRNDLVHFGPRIRNDRAGELKPLISPRGFHAPGRESLFWPNDDGRGMVFQHSLREGNMVRILRTQGVRLAQVQSDRSGSSQPSRRGGASAMSTSTSTSTSAGRLTSAGRITAMVWRVNATNGHGIEMYTAHGDGRIGAWLPHTAMTTREDEDEDDHDDEVEVEDHGPDRGGAAAAAAAARDRTAHLQPQQQQSTEAEEAENRRKRKRALIGDLVEGLAKRPLAFP